MNWPDMAGMQRSLIERAADVYWAGRGRGWTIKADPRCAQLNGSAEEMKSIDELAANLNFTTAKDGVGKRSVTFSAGPAPGRNGRYTVISVDDHIVEPPDTFTGRLAAKVRRPRTQGSWTPRPAGRRGCMTARNCPTSGFNAVVGRPVSEYGFEAGAIR